MGSKGSNRPKSPNRTNRHLSQVIDRWLPGEPESVDRAAWLTIAVVIVAIAVLLLFGDHSVAGVRSFSWQNRDLSYPDRAFILTFNRPVDRDTVEDNLKIQPKLPGRFSWSGARMAYTVDEPVPYGESFTLTLKNATTLPIGLQKEVQTFEPFTGKFAGRDAVFAYVGVDGEEAERLVLYNVTQQIKTLLTPPELKVTDFLPFPDRDRILFGASLTPEAAKSARSVKSKNDKGNLDLAADVTEQQLYTVTTGMDERSPPSGFNPLQIVQSWFNSGPPEAGQLELVLDAEEYQNLKFDLSPDGRAIVVQRVDRQNPDEFGLWAIVDGAPPRRIPTEQGGEFLIAPDSQALAMTQGEGLAILPLPKTTTGKQRRQTFQTTIKPLEFLPKFGELLNFSPNGSAAALVKFNKDYTRSLFVARNTGQEIELGNINGSIRSAEFSPDGKWLYCLLAEIVGDPGAKNYQEQPYIALINVENKETQLLVLLPDSQAIQMDLSPDGRSLLFSRPVLLQESGEPPVPDDTPLDDSATTSQLWQLQTQRQADGKWIANEPEALPITGIQPRWLP